MKSSVRVVNSNMDLIISISEEGLSTLVLSLRRRASEVLQGEEKGVCFVETQKACGHNNCSVSFLAVDKFYLGIYIIIIDNLKCMISFLHW